MRKKIDLFLEKLKEMPDFSKVRFVFLYGSYSNGKKNKFSDIDIAIYYEGNESGRFKFRKKILGKISNDFDIHIFQDLPLFIRMNVLKGKLIYFDDEGFVYEEAYKTIKRFENIKEYYEDYIKRRPSLI